jgi:hypothetical protein
MIRNKKKTLRSRRRALLDVAIVAGLAATGTSESAAALGTVKPQKVEGVGNWISGPDPIYEKAAPVTLAEFDARAISPGVTIAEVSDFAPAHYHGELSPSPPHADQNAKHSVVIAWSGKPHRLVFSHEASYDPIMELPCGASLCNQFFEGNFGWAELFNNYGRKERNSFVDIVQSDPRRAWVRWNYFCVNKDGDGQPALRGTEDYVTHPNGLIWRRLTYRSTMPDDPRGYSWQPIDFFGAAPAGTTWNDLFHRDEQHGDYLVGIVIDAYSPRRYELFWGDDGSVRRNGNPDLLLAISRSRGFALIMPYKQGYLFTVLGAASGFPSEKSQVVDNSFKDTGGWGWGAARWDHWPIGWLNSQTHHYQPGGMYPYSFGTFSHYIVNQPFKDAHQEFEAAERDMDLNRWSERHVYYTLTGLAQDTEHVRRLAKSWLDQGSHCASPESIADLK